MIIYKGAEAIIRKIDENVVIKERIEKKYRLKEIDEKLRKERTKKEVKFLIEVRRLGINVPRVLEIGDFYFKMEFIDGKKLKDVINEDNYTLLAKEMGKIVSTLHSNNIVHNDLTLSNMLLYRDKIYVIDFGLSEYSNSIESKAEDLLTLYYSVKSLFPSFFEIFINCFFESYIRNYEEGFKVIERMKKILKRGRYMVRNGG